MFAVWFFPPTAVLCQISFKGAALYKIVEQPNICLCLLGPLMMRPGRKPPLVFAYVSIAPFMHEYMSEPFILYKFVAPFL